MGSLSSDLPSMKIAHRRLYIRSKDLGAGKESSLDGLKFSESGGFGDNLNPDGETTVSQDISNPGMSVTFAVLHFGSCFSPQWRQLAGIRTSSAMGSQEESSDDSGDDDSFSFER